MRMRVTTAMWRARLRRRSPPRLIRCRTVLGEEAGIGLTPARLANAALERTRPRCDHAVKDCCGHRSDAGLVEEARRWACGEEGRHLLGVRGQLVVGCDYPLGEPDGLESGDSHGELLVTCAPHGDGGDLAGRPSAAGVDAEVDHAQQGGQRVDRCGPLGADVITRSDEDPQRLRAPPRRNVGGGVARR